VINRHIEKKQGISKLLDSLCLSPAGAIGLVFLLVAPILPFPPLNKPYFHRLLILAGIMGIGSMAFDFSSGYINIVNFGFAAFMGIGSYTSAILERRYGIPVPVTMVCGTVVAALLGVITGILSLRLRGIFAVFLTWFIGLALFGLIINLDWLTQGRQGLPVNTLFKPGTPDLVYYYVLMVIALLTWYLLKRIVRSPLGLAFQAIGQNLEAAKTSGINPALYRIINFTISCAIAGLVGAYYAHYVGIIVPDVLSTQKTVEILVLVYIGGRGSLWGGFALAFPFIYLTEMLRSTLDSLPGVNLLIYGVILIAVMIYYPGGLAQFYKYIADKVKPFLLENRLFTRDRHVPR